MSVMPTSYPGVVGGTRGALGMRLGLERSGLRLRVLGPEPLERRFLLGDLFREPVGGRTATTGVGPGGVPLPPQTRRFCARRSARALAVLAAAGQRGHRREPAETHVARRRRQLLQRAGGEL